MVSLKKLLYQISKIVYPRVKKIQEGRNFVILRKRIHTKGEVRSKHRIQYKKEISSVKKNLYKFI